MQEIKVIVDELAMFNTLIDNKNLMLKILAGLDDELHENLINHEAYIKSTAQKKQSLSNMIILQNPTPHPLKITTNNV